MPARRTALSRILGPARLCGALLAAAVSVVGAGESQARDGKQAVDVELVLAVDISYSMDTTEQRLQRSGYVQALTSPQFLNALRSGPTGRIAIKYIQWASYSDQDTLIDWTLIDGPDSARRVADLLAEAPYRRAQRTSVSGAIDAAANAFVGNGFSGGRQVIDVSGDGPNNNGRVVTTARDEAVAKGITINGLPLVGIRPWFGPADIKELDVYYEDCVIGGPDSFMIVIHDQKDFVDATRTKLIREIASTRPALPFIRVAESAPRISCTIGESLWNRQWGN
jgi:hypothetical protein